MQFVEWFQVVNEKGQFSTLNLRIAIGQPLESFQMIVA